MAESLWQWLTRRLTRRIWTGAIALAACTALLLVACQPAAISAVDATFEAKVLEVIRKNPQAILDSVASYNQQQSSRQRETRQAFVTDSRRNPQKIIGTSPTKGTGKQALVVEFSDFQCPYCQRAIAPADEFLSQYGDRVTLVFKHFPLSNIHAQARPAAQAAWAAGQQGKFWEFHDRLFQNQSRLGEGLYKELAQSLGLDVSRFESDRTSQAAQKAVQADFELGESLGIEGTPTFLVNGQPLQAAPSLEAFKTAFEKAKA